jgi:hypothetical protein
MQQQHGRRDRGPSAQARANAAKQASNRTIRGSY